VGFVRPHDEALRIRAAEGAEVKVTRDFHRWRPVEFTFPSGPPEVELRLVSRGAYRTYSALYPLNRFRVTLLQRFR
jgi:hypothetical protein